MKQRKHIALSGMPKEHEVLGREYLSLARMHLKRVHVGSCAARTEALIAAENNIGRATEALSWAQLPAGSQEKKMMKDLEHDANAAFTELHRDCLSGARRGGWLVPRSFSGSRKRGRR